MATPPLNPKTVQSLAEETGLMLDAAASGGFANLANAFLSGFDLLESLPEPPRDTPPERSWHRPDDAENPLGAWVIKTSIREHETGRLAGRTLVAKDNVCVAGVPLSGGASVLDSFTPTEDATIIRRVLAAGAEVVGKSACEYFSASGGSHTSSSGPIRNPHRSSHTSGGSSSGSGALVGSGEVDLAIGGDQGGSIRIPASYCGIVGMKPTWGLVPYTGILSIDPHIDHVGPMTATVADNALLLEVIAGPDGLDPRQLGVSGANYTNTLSHGVQGLRVGLLEEGFAECSAGVVASVRDAGKRLEAAGAEVQHISIPQHPLMGLLVTPFLLIGGMRAIRSGGFATHHLGEVPFGLPEAFETMDSRTNELPANLKAMWLAAASLERTGKGPALYAKAKRLRIAARAEYDAALSELDALLMPTTTVVAPPLCPTNASPTESVAAIGEGIRNTGQFDVTGHPAVSVPAGSHDGLPVGAMLVGRHFDEATLYRLAECVHPSPS